MRTARTRTHARYVIVLLAAVLVASACGSRLPDQTLKAIDASLTGAAAGGSSGAAASGATGAGNGTATAAEVGTAASTPAGGGTATTAAPGGENPATAAAGTAAANCTPSAATVPGVTPKELKVASIVTDSGPLPGATEGSYRGAAAYFAMINSQGGVCGRRLTVVKGDDGLDPARARGEFLRLEPQVLGFVGSFAVADSGYIDLIEKTKVPFIGLTVDPAGRKLPTTFPKLADDRVNTGPYVYLKREHPDVTKTAILYADIAGVGANIDGTAKAIQKAGFELVSPPIPVGVADPDYTGQVRNLQDKGVDFVFLFAFEVNMHVRFNRNMRQQRYEPKIKASNIAFNDRFSKLLGTEGDGWENTLAHLPFLDPAEKGRSKPVNDFLTWNARLFPGAQLDLFNIAGWGRAAMFVEALRKVGGDVNRATLLKGLSGVPVYNGGGMEIDSNAQTGEINKCFAMAKHVGGSWKRSYPTGAGYECNLGEVLKFK